MDSPMKTRMNELMKNQPGLGIARRSSILVAASGPYHSGLQRELNKFPLVNLALSGAVSSFYLAMTAGPQLAIEQAADQALGGRPTTPEQVAARRKVLIAGNAATIAAAVVVQRAITHSPRSGPLLDAGRVISSQVAIGAAAGAIVTASDAILGPLARRKDKSSPATIAVSAAIMAMNRRLLKKSAAALTLPTTPTPYAYVS
jgi:hypothetical protein